MTNTSLRPGVRVADKEDDCRAWDLGRNTEREKLGSCFRGGDVKVKIPTCHRMAPALKKQLKAQRN